MSDVIKVNHLERDRIKKIFIFAGKRRITTDGSWQLDDGTNIFTESELAKIKQNNIEIEVVDGYLHGDDTVGTIKNKIIKYTNLRSSTKELYLFGVHTKPINPAILYNRLTQNDTYKLTGRRLCQFLLNIISGDCDKAQAECPLEEKESDVYDFEDMMTIDGLEWDAPITYTLPIGQKLVIKKQFPFVANPYNCIAMDNIVKTKANTNVSTQNSNLLFEYGSLCNNNIFFCLAEEVLEFVKTLEDTTEREFIQLYFPNLFQKNQITTLRELRDQKIALYDEQRDIFNDKFEMYNDRVDLLYDIFYNRKHNLEYQDNTPGVLKTEFTIHPRYPMKMPLEMLFKLINSNTTLPMVKYNPGRDRENIYRLYANKLATNGKRIPYLYTMNDNRKGKIIKLSKLLARKKRVAYYVEYLKDSIKFAIACEFEANGNVNITVQHSAIVNKDMLETAISESLNPLILRKVQRFLEQSGYTFQIFESFDQDNIEFKDITFVSILEVKKNIKLKSYTGCLSSVFTLLDDSLSSQQEELRLKYKRVSNYNELDSIDSFINEMRKNDEDPNVIIRKLSQNFNLDDADAKARFSAWATQINVEADLYENKAITVRTNTGFPITITRNNVDFTTTVKTTDINEIGYLKYIFIYIDSLLRLVINKKSTNVKASEITSLCKGKTIVEADQEQDIVTHKIRFKEDRNKATAFLEMFGQEEEDEDGGDEVDFEGVEFGEIDSIGSTRSPAQDLSGDVGVEMAVAEEKKGDTGVVEAEFDFGDMDFGDFSEELSETPGPLIRQLSEVRSLPPPEKKRDISPESDISSQAEVNLKGLQLKGTNNIFMKKKEDLQPELFLKKESGRYKAYSKACPSQYSKQPIILTEDEKEYIDEKDAAYGTKSYDEHITYGTGQTKYHYICPRFWCLSDKNGKSRSISLEEINSGACGGWDALIPEGSSTVPDGKRIYEFTDERMHKSKTKTDNLLVYKPMFPSFMDKSKHPDGLCIPCCFTRPTTFDPKNSNWTIRTNAKGKEEYYNTETKAKQSKYPTIEYDNMYKPVGEGPGGPGPAFELDADGNIKMDTIRGVKETRDAPANSRKQAFNECNQSVNKKKLSVKAKSAKVDDAPLLEAWPLNPGQIGYIPLALQKFLGYNCRKICQESLMDNNLKMGQPCLLHKGMEKSDKQSFLACIADIYNDELNPQLESRAHTLSSRPPMTIRTLKEIITRQLTLDRFIQLQNGDLISIFAPENYDEVDITPYKQSKLYKSLNKTTTSDLYFKKVIGAFLNFGRYLSDDDIVIDYKYIWDFITLPISEDGSGLFRNGINMIILKSPEDDVTSKIELICPTNFYSGQVYDINKPTLILYTRNGYFEPVYKYTKVKRHFYNIQKLFNMRNIMRELPNVGSIIKHIWTDLTVKCKPLPSMPAEYNQKFDFRENLDFNSILEILRASKSVYTFKAQVANYSSRVVGLLLQKGESDDDTIFLPCLPSPLNDSIPTVFINSGAAVPLNNYNDTIEKLKYLKTTTRSRLLCAPKFKLVNDSVIIGVITETNQMVPVIPEAYQVPAGGIEPDGISVISKKISPEPFNYLELDNNLLINTSIDTDRVRKVRNIKLESHFYNIFRNMIRIVLAYYENKDIKNHILDTITSPIIPYYNKLKEVETQLKTIMSPHIIFTEFGESALANMNEIEICLNMIGDRCNRKEYCTFTPGDDGNGKCQMMLPRTNLISGGNNAVQYFARVANELIKFDRIRTFIFVPKTFLSFQNISYNLTQNEIVLLEDILYGDYFEDIVPQEVNPYTKDTSTWGTVEPADSAPYANTFNMSYDMVEESVSQCIVTDSQQKKLVLGRWGAAGFGEYSILEYKSSNSCSWEIIKDILNIHRPGEDNSVSFILRTLVSIYDELSRSAGYNKILDILKMQGKRNQVQSISSGVPLSDVITPSNYFLTSLDFFLLSNNFNIPLILLCRTKIPSLFSPYVSFMARESQGCYIIFAGGYSNTETNNSPNYGILSKSDSIQLSIADMGDSFEQITKLNITTLDSFIKRTTLAKALAKQKKPKVKVKLGPRVKKIKTKVKLG